MRRGEVWTANLSPNKDTESGKIRAMTEQIRAVDRARIGDGPLTKLRPQEMANLERSLLAVLALSVDQRG